MGDADRARHRAVVAGLAGVYLLEDEAPASARPVPECPPGILTVLTPPEDRAWRVEEALARGWAVLARAPVVSSVARARALEASARSGGGCLQVEAPPLHTDLSDRAAGAFAGLGVVDYVRLQLGVPRTWLAERPEGVLESEGLWTPWLLEGLLGPLDTVAAHSRSLVRNRPTEDLIVAHLEFACGAEGTLEVHALAAHLAAAACLHAYGAAGEARVCVDLRRARVTGLRRQYGLLRDHLVGVREQQDTGLDAAALPQALGLATWLRQSARLRRRLPRRERPSC